ncbi:MAG: ABC transporter substrate-binding protein [Clostridia bacterium]
MKKIIITLLLICSIAGATFAFVGCSPKADYTVGICQQLEHGSLDKANAAFRDELTKLMGEKGKTVHFDIKNASNDTAAMTSIANNFVAKNYNLLLGIATGAAQQLAGATQDSKIPVLFTAVTDPVGSNLIGSYTDPALNGNVTGTSDMGEMDKQVDLIEKMVGKSGADLRIGVLYTTNETNSKVQFAAIKAEAEKRNIVVVEKGIAELTEIETAFGGFDGKCDIVYLPTDNKLANAMATVHTKNKDGAKLPVVCGAVDMAVDGGTASLGADYVGLGKQTAKMAFDILFTGKKTTEIQYEMSKSFELYINEPFAADINFVIPQAVKDMLKK